MTRNHIIKSFKTSFYPTLLHVFKPVPSHLSTIGRPPMSTIPIFLVTRTVDGVTDIIRKKGGATTTVSFENTPSLISLTLRLDILDSEYITLTVAKLIDDGTYEVKVDHQDPICLPSRLRPLEFTGKTIDMYLRGRIHLKISRTDVVFERKTFKRVEVGKVVQRIRNGYFIPPTPSAYDPVTWGAWHYALKTFRDEIWFEVNPVLGSDTTFGIDVINQNGPEYSLVTRKDSGYRSVSVQARTGRVHDEGQNFQILVRGVLICSIYLLPAEPAVYMWV